MNEELEFTLAAEKAAAASETPKAEKPKSELPKGADAAAPFRDKLAELDAKIAALKMERVKLSATLAPKHPNIRKLDAEVEALEEARASFVATNPQALSPKPPAASQPLLPPPPVANPASVAQPLPEFVFARRDWSRLAKVAVGDGVTVAIHEEVISELDIMATARIRYTAADGAVKGHDMLLASDVSGSRAKWAYGWARGTKTFWVCSVSPDNSYSLHRVSFADPQRITDDFQQYYPGEEPQRTLGVPDAFYSQLVDVLGFQKWTVVDKSNGLPEISGQHVAAAQSLTPAGVPVKAATTVPLSKDKRWKVQFVDAATGQPVPRLRVTIASRTADGSHTTSVTKVVSDSAFERNLNADEHAWVSVVDETWTNANDAVRLFGNVPADAQAAEKHTDPDAPFIVKVKPRVKQANAGADAGNPTAKPPGANIVKVPDDQYVKSGFPKDELDGEGVMWNDAQNGLSLGYRITGDEWRILGKDVKVELWVRNPGDKDVKFQLNMRPDIGLRMTMKGEKGAEHESNIVPNDVPPFGELRLLPPGHALKVKEFTVSLLWPENDVSGIKGHFFAINPGAYNFQCELELPGFSATGEGGKQLTPAADEWVGKLTTRSLNVVVVAPDAPAPKPRVEHVSVRIGKDGEVSLERTKMSLDELKTRAARNAKKWFTIEADEDVPYAKVVEVMNALRKAGVVRISLKDGQAGDGKVRVASSTGSYKIDDQRTFSVCKLASGPGYFTVHWRAKAGDPVSQWVRIHPVEPEGVRGTWAVAWEPGTDVLWWMDAADIGRMNFSDPKQVIVERSARVGARPPGFVPPDGVIELFESLGFFKGLWNRGSVGGDGNLSKRVMEATPAKASGGGKAQPEDAADDVEESPPAPPESPRADVKPDSRHLFNEGYGAIAVQSAKDVNFLLFYEGFLSTGLSESWSETTKQWSIEGNIHLVDPEKTKLAGKNVDKRVVAVKYTSDAPDTLFLDGKAYGITRNAQPGRVFILRDEGAPVQADRTLPLRDEKDLADLAQFADSSEQ